MENKETQDKLLMINRTESPNKVVRYYCKINIKPDILVKFSEKYPENLLNKLGHILIALTHDEERRQT